MANTNVIYNVFNLERPDNEQKDRSVRGVRADILLKTDSVRGLPVDGTFLPASTAWHPQSGKKYVLNADCTAWVLIAGSQGGSVPTEDIESGVVLAGNDDGTYGWAYLGDMLPELGSTSSAGDTGIIATQESISDSEEESYPTVAEFNALLASLRAAGILETPAAAETE